MSLTIFNMKRVKPMGTVAPGLTKEFIANENDLEISVVFLVNTRYYRSYDAQDLFQSMIMICFAMVQNHVIIASPIHVDLLACFESFACRKRVGCESKVFGCKKSQK